MDTGVPFPEHPATQLAVNFPLVDILPNSKNGPVEIAKGTHLLSVKDGLALHSMLLNATGDDDGNVRLEPVWLRRGDLIVRDVRGLHRGETQRHKHRILKNGAYFHSIYEGRCRS